LIDYFKPNKQSAELAKNFGEIRQISLQMRQNFYWLQSVLVQWYAWKNRLYNQSRALRRKNRDPSSTEEL